jgi:pyrroline-5-carboxylate reductase
MTDALDKDAAAPPIDDGPESQGDDAASLDGRRSALNEAKRSLRRLTPDSRGFDKAQARLMVEQTFLGASELLAVSDVGPEELRRRVTSPKGTTERAIAEIAAADLTSVFDRAAASAIARAEEMARGE